VGVLSGASDSSVAMIAHEAKRDVEECVRLSILELCCETRRRFESIVDAAARADPAQTREHVSWQVASAWYAAAHEPSRDRFFSFGSVASWPELMAALRHIDRVTDRERVCTETRVGGPDLILSDDERED
jgi:hypothetical protein